QGAVPDRRGRLPGQIRHRLLPVRLPARPGPLGDAPGDAGVARGRAPARGGGAVLAARLVGGRGVPPAVAGGRRAPGVAGPAPAAARRAAVPAAGHAPVLRPAFGPVVRPVPDPAAGRLRPGGAARPAGRPAPPAAAAGR